MKKIWIYHKKKIILVLAAAVWLVGCYFIGQLLHKDKTKDDALSVVETQMEEKKFSVDFLNVAEVSDNPWGISGGVIPVEDEGDCIYLTPGTKSEVTTSAGVKSISVSAKIHPWMVEKSDGVGVVISFFYEDGAVSKEVFSVNPSSEWQSIMFPFEKNIKRLVFECNTGEKDDGTGDWLIFKLD